MSVAREDVLDVLRQIKHPKEEKDIIRLDMVKDLTIEDGHVSFTVVVKDPDGPFANQVEEACRRLLHEEVSRELSVEVEVDSEMIPLGDDVMVGDQGGEKQQTSGEDGVQNTIAVASGKGGVGKSTVAVNLAMSLSEQGYEVALVDTDIYGPSIPKMMGMEGEKPRVNDERKMVPLEKHGVKTLSMGFMVDPDQAVVWRGPMVTKAVRQFLGDVDWGDIEYMILDLPPGTGDVQLTIVQTIPLTGAVIVSTPQDLALADARKGKAMFDNVNVPVVGMVENMAYFSPPDQPDRKYYLFGRAGAQELAQELDVPFLGEVPIQQEIRKSSDQGTPIVRSAPDSASTQAFAEIADQLTEQVALRNAEDDPTQKIEILYE
ncbi:ATP-binding protein involved in chromosome partitioning [Salinibacter ruber]|jgi:ATP-binding protein involved in chromosome partitioning|uniref:Iron-sulfur cluster carrier protein n=1 Tax=Salinibacter ruber TaxID=146919 RepID=A0A9X2QEF6_9BACT|nr:Mrp/NBP35 family ATP-binding protein [Salinibacter ruber]MBB4061914.1 ATP-binding protein involved in chromosome partitioning [Salinibacter ruber]MCS3637231.1 ATP-binding protein involved in chromosome partitioning [Salinibacter ruber]MCS3661856.1 ATP-binding protein involved in chromosome partitioning [Salinibacter ruber]MCS3670373.1 ATP-binding protein involved in chromosome partitioning [Salinibacter ruber]MCS3711652.1 ATP-binding protein involved in chromosome partitioning [Salinibacter